MSTNVQSKCSRIFKKIVQRTNYFNPMLPECYLSEKVITIIGGGLPHSGVDAFTGKVHTFADMSERSIKCALWLKKQGVKPGDIIGLCTDNNLDAFLVLLGIMYIGATCNTWDHNLSPITARYFLELTSPKIVFTISSSAASLRQTAKELKMNLKVVVLDKLDEYESLDEDVLRGHDTREIVEFKCFTTKPDDVALIVPSSGTTGLPKATKLSHYSLHCCMHSDKVRNLQGHIFIIVPTVRWNYGVLMSFRVISVHAKKIIVPDNDDAEGLLQFIEKYQVSLFSTDPFILIKLIKNELLDKYRLPSLKMIISSGAHLRKEYQDILREKLPHVFVNNSYGLTDAGCVCTAQTKFSKPGSIGYVLPDVCIKIVDLQTEKALGPNKTGELRIKAISTMQGYHNNPETTKKSFDSDGWLRTGDVAYYDDDGEIFLVDRISDFIIFRSINVSPAEIETVLATHPAVLLAVVIGIPHEVDEEHPMAVILLLPGKSVTEKELINLVEKNMPDHCRLRGGVIFVDQLPRTTTGKIARKQLRDIYTN
ncbi:PREDICTED: 4-coumarate--CoA ligase 1-like isoform X2 [Dinoponera quadriceps]|uniref:4-coumarate--CoA ligase 1-like isoform X2 n=1 Tax=Dinoponera quadriceps TaxID=609295 RepID=A0A6P3Y422_DINQU|nr:PREDICTED: 4-coumarate--CoA ligase 1-like isoform X2 [Dinoponera quadriceps]